MRMEHRKLISRWRMEGMPKEDFNESSNAFRSSRCIPDIDEQVRERKAVADILSELVSFVLVLADQKLRFAAKPLGIGAVCTGADLPR